MPDSRPVVSNTTPLITLAGVGLLDLLPTLYSEVRVPDTVYREYQIGRSRHPESPDLDSLPWLSVHTTVANSAVPGILDDGEAATLALALASHARLVLLDERQARKEAIRLGLVVAGSLGVLLVAKQRGLVPAVGPILDRMVEQGRRIGAGLRAQVLTFAEEGES